MYMLTHEVVEFVFVTIFLFKPFPLNGNPLLWAKVSTFQKRSSGYLGATYKGLKVQYLGPHNAILLRPSSAQMNMQCLMSNLESVYTKHAVF